MNEGIPKTELHTLGAARSRARASGHKSVCKESRCRLDRFFAINRFAGRGNLQSLNSIAKLLRSCVVQIRSMCYGLIAGHVQYFPVF